MTRHNVSWWALLVVAPFLAGCLDGGDGRDDEGTDAPTPEPGILAGYPLPAPDGVRTRDWIATFAQLHPLRVTGSPTESAGADHIVSDLESYGYTVQVMTFGAPGIPLDNGQLRVVIGTIAGTTMPDHWLAWGGHYDTVPQTVYGAYDNGSGTGLALELARMLSTVETNRTRAVIMFNGEEEGTLASTAFVDWYESQSDFTIDLFVGFDMVGIAYPAPGRPLAFFSGDAYGADFVPLARTAAIDVLGLPDDNTSVTFSPRNSRNSDEASFADAGIATMRFAGLQTAGDYWGYHRPNDTMETIYAMSDGPDNFAQALGHTAAFAYVMILALDVAGIPDIGV